MLPYQQWQTLDFEGVTRIHIFRNKHKLIDLILGSVSLDPKFKVHASWLQVCIEFRLSHTLWIAVQFVDFLCQVLLVGRDAILSNNSWSPTKFRTWPYSDHYQMCSQQSHSQKQAPVLSNSSDLSPGLRQKRFLDFSYPKNVVNKYWHHQGKWKELWTHSHLWVGVEDFPSKLLGIAVPCNFPFKHAENITWGNDSQWPWDYAQL